MEVSVTYLLQVLGELYVENKIQGDRIRELEIENINLRLEAPQPDRASEETG
jgi:hypothetical protein